jgi:hypothetical protein
MMPTNPDHRLFRSRRNGARDSDVYRCPDCEGVTGTKAEIKAHSLKRHFVSRPKPIPNHTTD